MSESEEWRPVVGYEGSYEVSNQGRVRSLDRRVPWRNGRTRFSAGRLLSASRATTYPTVSLMLNGQAQTFCVHTLVTTAFIGPRPEGMYVCHANGDHFDNRIINLRYDTPSANNLDAVRHGTHSEASKTHCIHGHPFVESNIYWHPTSGERCCRACRRRRGAEQTARERKRRERSIQGEASV